MRLVGEVSKAHEMKFIAVKGLLGSKSNGDALEKIVDIAHKHVLEQALKG